MVIDLDERRPHEVAFAQCACGRFWVAVFPCAAAVLECPACGAMLPTDELSAAVRYQVDVPAAEFEKFSKFLESSRVSYSRVATVPWNRQVIVE